MSSNNELMVFRKIMIATLTAALLPLKSLAFDFPKDLPTFEALMALHKAVKKDEDQALARIATSFGEQSLVTKGAEKFNDVRSTLDTKLNNAHSYVVLAAAISSTASSLYLLTKEYKDFTANTYKYVSKKPFVAWYYTEANVAIAREIKHAQKLYVTVAASGINLMKASMDEKLNLVMTLKDSIENARRIIDNANLYCYLVTDCGWKPDYIWEILTSDVKDRPRQRKSMTTKRRSNGSRWRTARGGSPPTGTIISCIRITPVRKCTGNGPASSPATGCASRRRNPT